MQINISEKELSLFKELITDGCNTNKIPLAVCAHKYQYDYFKSIFDLGTKILSQIEKEENEKRR